MKTYKNKKDATKKQKATTKIKHERLRKNRTFASVAEVLFLFFE